MGAQGAGLRETIRIIDGGAKGQCGDRADARHGHQTATGCLIPHNGQHLAGQASQLLSHHAQRREEGRDDGHDGAVLSGQLMGAATPPVMGETPITPSGSAPMEPVCQVSP